MSAVRAALGSLRALGAREKVYAEFLASRSKGFVAANEAHSESFPVVARLERGAAATTAAAAAAGYGLFCGPRPVRAGQEILRVPPTLWVPYCSEVAVRKAEAGAPEVLARLSRACASIGGGNARDRPWLEPFACLALELLFTLERDENDPYLAFLWEASRSEASLPHPLLMESRHLDFLQASPLRRDIVAAKNLYSAVHRHLFGLGNDDSAPLPGGDRGATKPSAASTQDFLWALGVILSRGVGEDGAGGAGLVPYLDFANHGDEAATGAEGLRGRASCERGFDAATGTHFLRALRNVEPGEELLIDYGSAAKGIYCFARTYGFISYENRSDRRGRLSSSSLPSDAMRVRVDVTPNPSRASPVPEDLQTSEDAAPSKEKQELGGETRLGRLAKGQHGVEGTGSGVPADIEEKGKAGKPIDSRSKGRGSEQGDAHELNLAVSLGDVVDALAWSNEPSSAEKTGSSRPGLRASGAGASATIGGDHAETENSLPIRERLEDLLRGYATTLEEDLTLLGKLSAGEDKLEAANASCGEGDSLELLGREASGRLTAEWVEMCVRIRAAEKIALERALLETRSGP